MLINYFDCRIILRSYRKSATAQFWKYSREKYYNNANIQKWICQLVISFRNDAETATYPQNIGVENDEYAGKKGGGK